MKELIRCLMNHSAWRTPFVLALSLTAGLGLALGTECPVGVNVNSFQNFSATEQQMIVEQLKSCGVSFVRTSLRPDDKNMNLAKNLQSEGIGLVLVPGVEFYPLEASSGMCGTSRIGTPSIAEES